METKELKEKLFLSRKNGYAVIDDSIKTEAFNFCEGYKDYLNNSKTERKAVKTSVSLAQKAGFKEYKQGESYKAGDKLYVNNRGKAAAFIVVGEEDIELGATVTAAHIDSPRLDLKPNPLYEDTELGLLKTH